MRVRLISLVVSVLVVVLALPGCGFHLRGQPGFAASLPPVQIELQDARTPLGRAVLTAFARNGVVVAAGNGTTAPVASLRVHVTEQREERRGRTLTRGIQVAEYDLNVELRFELFDGAGHVVVPEQRLFATRAYSRDQENLLTNETTEDLLWKELRSDVAEQLVAALAARHGAGGTTAAAPASQHAGGG